MFPHERLRHYTAYTAKLNAKVFVERSIEDTMPIEPNPEAEDLVKLIESQAW